MAADDPVRADSLLADLNPEQRTAVTSPPGPLLVLAGAGSGKTRVLTRRLAWLVRSGADPYRVLAITFTNKAAREMADRVADLLGATARGMWVHTFHSACARILRREIERFGYTPQFTILDADDQRSAVREVCRELGYDDKRFPAAAVAGRISRAKNELRSPAAEGAAARDPWSQRVAVAYERYQAKLAAANCLDFDDLLGLTVRLLEEDDGERSAASRYRALFRHLLVDEYQDTNHAQYRLIRALAREHRSVTAVGDEDQSIYRFRGADQGNILRFEEDFADARVVRLERNYRSTQSILDAAGSVIVHNPRRYPKKLWTDRGDGEPIVLYLAADPADEAAFVARQISLLRPAARGYSDFAVLYRTHAQSRAVEEALLAHGTPYVVVGGVKFYDRKEVKDALAWMRLCCNPRDWPSFRRAVAAPRRGIGDATIAALARHMDATGESLPSVLAHASDVQGAQRSARTLAAFAALLDRLRGEAEGSVDARGEPLPAEARRAPAEVAEVVASILDRSGMAEELRRQDTIESRARLENLEELVSVARQNGPACGSGLAGMQQFLEQASLIAEADTVPGEAEGEGAGEAVVLLTLHAAKGLEFPTVFLLGLEEGVFPHSRALDSAEDVEEERRLCYVGMTRARRRLFLSSAAERARFGGEPARSKLSRFLAELDRSAVREQTSAGRRSGGAGLWRAAGGPRRPQAGAAAAAGGADDLHVGDRVRHPRWGEGTVIQCRGKGPEGEVTVDFPDGGRRTLILGFARLQRLA